MTARTLRFLADMLEAGRLPWPPDLVHLRSVGIDTGDDECWRLTSGADAAGAARGAAVWLLRQIAGERDQCDALVQAVVPVVSGPRVVPGLRETADAFLDVINRAKRNVLITGFALHSGQTVLARLAERMMQEPALDVVLCLDISRSPGDTSDEQEIISRFAYRFRTIEWPQVRLPKLFYDPRSLARSLDERSVLHAKIAVADSSCALIGSANLTEAAQKRNIEIGVLIAVPAFVESIRAHVEALIHHRILVRVPL
jgi:phosphatidylserine/phosphatidylglycerophosphate/cardiolipin synthase-like enzyme